MQKLRIIVGGFMAILPAGGATWDYIQYPLGFSLMGHDVYYIEDTRLYPIYQKTGSDWDDCSSCVERLKSVMDYFNMSNRWAYRDEASGRCFGLSESEIKEICRGADVFVNISCSTCMREEYLKIPARILIDSDPMFTQIQYMSQQMFTPGKPGLRELLDQHNYLFTFGENIGSPDCRIPDCNLLWHITRQPVCMNYWKPNPLPANDEILFTTLMNWSAAKKLKYNDTEWGQKDIEFNKFIKLPDQMPAIQLAMVINQTGGIDQTLQKQQVEAEGWKILSPDQYASNWKDYQTFIQQSDGEFSVAKETYVKANTGWFSCRSACYLAAGRPVVTQDTGWSKYISSGNGLFAFHNVETAVDALKSVTSNLAHHAKAARSVAEDFFDSRKVLNSLLEKLA